MEYQQFLQAATIPVFMVSKLPQIWINFQNKSVGQLSGITVTLNFVGSLVRVFTTFTQVDDKVVLAGYLIGTALNAILFLQVMIYGGGDKEPKDKKRA